MAILHFSPTKAGLPLLLAVFAAPAAASDGETGIRIEPILETRLRYESVEQAALEADAVTLRLRAGAEVKVRRLSFLAEAEGTAAAKDDYNAFPFPLAGESQRRPQFAVVPDPHNLEINRLQMQYTAGRSALTLGRQRINLDDQRWVGSVGWRQNEQTFDAVRAQGTVGPLNADFAYASAQRSIFGEDAGIRTAYDGDIIMGGLAAKAGPIEGKLFAYLLDYDEPFFAANSSQTYGAIVRGSVPLGGATNLALRASYARQKDWGSNPHNYAADYWAFEGGSTVSGFAIAAGWERLGSDNSRSVQTPAATLHKFNGWADLFLTTPTAGLEDAYVSLSKSLTGWGALPAINVAVTYHQFDSAAGDVEYGTEWDASIGFKVGGIGWLLKVADYRAVAFGVDTRKVWLQAEWAL